MQNNWANYQRVIRKWKGAFRDFLEISKMEGVNYDNLKSCFYRSGSITKAITMAKSVRTRSKKMVTN